jgi:undecaprenyl-diphosphatase
MIPTILEYDIALFHFINTSLSNQVFDFLLPLFRNKYFWAPLYGFIAAFLAMNFTRDWWKIILFSIVAIALSDQISSSFIKPLVHRLRPCRDLLNSEYVRLIVNCGSGYSFPSSHAANHFAFVMFFFRLFPNKWILTAGMFWAATICFAQVYVGVHYPLDVSGGMLLGLFIGSIVASWYKFIIDRADNKV